MKLPDEISITAPQRPIIESKAQLTHLFLSSRWADQLHLHHHIIPQVFLEPLNWKRHKRMWRSVAL
jgi:hypothetical protein